MSSLRGWTEADVHVCLTVERSEGKSDGETETRGIRERYE